MGISEGAKFAFVVICLAGVALVVFWLSGTPAPIPPTAQDRAVLQFEREQKLSLCRVAAACKKYSDIRLECATAGNFKTCLHIKMGDDAAYINTCSGYREGDPAVALSAEEL